MSVIYDDQYHQYNNWVPTYFFTKPEKGDFTPFYVTVALCTVFGVFLCVLNIFFCCCSKHKHYWQDSNTGNRWILPIWNKTPHKQPPLDYTELDKAWLPVPITEVVYPLPSPSPIQYPRGGPEYPRGGPEYPRGGPEHHELQKIESDI